MDIPSTVVFFVNGTGRDNSSHYTKINWPLRQSLKPRRENVQHPPLVESKKILLLPFHIKFGHIKLFREDCGGNKSKI